MIRQPAENAPAIRPVEPTFINQCGWGCSHHLWDLCGISMGLVWNEEAALQPTHGNTQRLLHHGNFDFNRSGVHRAKGFSASVSYHPITALTSAVAVFEASTILPLDASLTVTWPSR